jgi:hypothetical protein
MPNSLEIKTVDVVGVEILSKQLKVVASNVSLLGALDMCDDPYFKQFYVQLYVIYHEVPEIIKS